MGLAQLARHADAAPGALEAADRTPPCIQPEQFRDGEHRAMCYPGDERHPVRARALPGPNSAAAVEGRFEPFDGFEGVSVSAPPIPLRPRLPCRPPGSWFARLSHLIALGFGAGSSRLAPGTVGTLWAWAARSSMR